MELIPILSTIILVATISTFLLAIGAYILYKIRERKGEQVPYPKPSTVRAELVTPEETEYRREEYKRPEEMRVPYNQQYKKPPSGPDVYPPDTEYQGAQPGHYASEEELRRNIRLRPGRKFLKYTSEGYIPTEEDKTSGVLKWR
jgi:hypothetical protein